MAFVSAIWVTIDNTISSKSSNSIISPAISRNIAERICSSKSCASSANPTSMEAAHACKNGSAMLFVSSKVSQLALLPQGRPEAAKRAKAMIMKMEELGFGNCTNTRACEAECPKNETIANIARLNREFIKAKLND